MRIKAFFISISLIVASSSCNKNESNNFTLINVSDSQIVEFELYKYTSYKNLEFNWDSIPLIKLESKGSSNVELAKGRYYIKSNNKQNGNVIFHFWINEGTSIKLKYDNNFISKDRQVSDYNFLMSTFSRYEANCFAGQFENIKDLENIYSSYMDSLDILENSVSDIYRDMILEERLYLTDAIHPIVSQKYNRKIGNFSIRNMYGTILSVKAKVDSLSLVGFYHSLDYKDFLINSLASIKLLDIKDPFIEGKYFAIVKQLDLDLKTAPSISEYIDPKMLPLSEFIETQILNTNNLILAENLLIELANKYREDHELSIKYNSWLLTDFFDSEYVKSGKARRMIAFHQMPIGSEAPDFTLNTLDKEIVKLSDYNGKYLLIDFWGTWCHPCREEIPDINRLFFDAPMYELEILGIAKDHENTLLSFLDSTNVQYKNVLATDKVIEAYGVLNYPEKFLIDKSGSIIAKNVSLKDVKQLIKENEK